MFSLVSAKGIPEALAGGRVQEEVNDRKWIDGAINCPLERRPTSAWPENINPYGYNYFHKILNTGGLKNKKPVKSLKNLFQYTLLDIMTYIVVHTHYGDNSCHSMDTMMRSLSSLVWAIACPWWRHQMEAFSALVVICAGNSPVTSEFH